MFGSAILDIAIGVVFVYLLLSLIISATNELIASALSWRSSNLEIGIQNLLNDPAGKGLAEQLYNHVLIKGLYVKGKRPSYIPSRTFALALLDIFAPNKDGTPQTLENIRADVAASGLNSEVRDALLVLIDSSINDVRKGISDFNKIQENVEIWFNSSMDRVSGWYKRKTQLMLAILSIIITFGLNVDTILIANTLSKDSALRDGIVAQAQRFAAQPPVVIQNVPPAAPSGQPDSSRTAGTATGSEASAPGNNASAGGTQATGEQGASTSAQATPQTPSAADVAAQTKAAAKNLQESVNDLTELGIPVGWKRNPAGNPRDFPKTFLSGVQKLFGLLLTALAVSLGAPFWFDVLNKFITIRSAGKAPEEAPKSPKEVPTPLEPGQMPGIADALKNITFVVPGAQAGGAAGEPPQK